MREKEKTFNEMNHNVKIHRETDVVITTMKSTQKFGMAQP